MVIDYAPKYTYLKMKISTIRARLAGGACRTVDCSYRIDLGSKTELRIKVKELLIDDAYLSKVVDDKESWFTQMEVLDLINHQFFFTTNSLGCQPTTSQYVQPLALQTLALAAAAIHCALSEYASGRKATVLFSQDEFWGTFGPSHVTNFTLEAIAQSITHQRAASYPPPVALLNPGWHSSILVGAPQPRLNHFYFIPQSIPPLSALLNPVYLDWCSSISFHTLSPRFRGPQPGMGAPQFPLALL